MSKYYGIIGFIKTENGEGEHRGVYKATTVERPYKINVLKNIVRWQDASDRLNDNLTVGNQLSVLADSFATSNLHCMKYVTYLGTRWNIVSATIEYPRIILSLGGVYNGEPVQSST